jgi:putative transposase
LYLAVVLDLYSRMVVGWAMAATDDAHLVKEALRMAFNRRHPQADLLHHSDQGSEYTSDAYLTLLRKLGHPIEHESDGQRLVTMRSWSGSSGPSSANVRCILRRGSLARSAIFDSIESFYNRVRRHSTLGYLSPVDFELSKR